MAFKKVALSICLIMAMDPISSQSTDPYNSPISENLIDPIYINPSRRSGGALDPGALIAVLAALGSAAVGGLAAFSASSTQIGVDDISQRLSDSDSDISSLRTLVSNLGDTLSTIQDQLRAVRNDAVTPAQLAMVTQTADSANNQVQDGIDEVGRRLRNNNRDISSLRSRISNLQGTMEEDARQTIASLAMVGSRVEAAEGKSDEICQKVNEVLNVGTLGGTTDDSIETFVYTDAITGGSQPTPPDLTLLQGGSFAPGAPGQQAGTAASPGALVADVDRLRVAVATAISNLDTKIDEILDKATLTC